MREHSMTREQLERAAADFKESARQNAAWLDSLPSPQGKASQPENAKFVAEFRAEPAYGKSMTIEQYVAMRRVDEGLDLLVNHE